MLREVRTEVNRCSERRELGEDVASPESTTCEVRPFSGQHDMRG